MAERRSKRVAVTRGKGEKLGRSMKKTQKDDGAALLVDFTKFEMTSLKKYQRFFKLEVRPNATKEELIRIVKAHFVCKPKLRETDVISNFLFALRNEPQVHVPAAASAAAIPR